MSEKEMQMKTHSSSLRVIALLMALAFVLAACPAAGPTGGETMQEGEMEDEGEVLTILYWQASSLPSAYLSGGTKDEDASAITLEPLANFNPDGALVPKLAVEIPTIENGGISEDLKSITWKLKEGVRWSDGTDLTADDVVFTWKYCSDEATGCTSSESFLGIEKVEALDDHTVKITFEAPTPYPYYAFVGAGTPIISRAQFADCVGAAAQQCNEQNTAPLGTGPFRIIDFKVNDVAVFERNPHYHGEPAYFDKVILKGGGDAASAARAVLETGEADYAWNLQVEPDILLDMQEAGQGQLVVAFARLVERILVNQTDPDPNLGDDRSVYMGGDNVHPFLSFPSIPRAMSMAIDRNLIAEQLYGLAGRATCNVIPAPAIYVSTANDGCLKQDIEGAIALLDENGVVDTDGDGIREYNGIPLKVSYQTSTNSIRQKTQALIRQWWAEIGIETELINHDAGVFFGGDPNSPDTYQKFYTDIQMYTTGPGIDPQQHLSEWLCSQIPTPDNAWGGGNIFRGCNSEYDELFEQLKGTPVGPEREAIVKRLNDINVQNNYQIPLVYRGDVSAHTSSLKGVWINGWDTEMWNIGEWHR
jgi:peptide/nickel transport system substrate-binding protein